MLSLTPLQGHRLAWAASLVVVALAFRSLIPYDPLPQARPGAGELEDWFFRPTGQSAPLIFGLAACFLYTRYRAVAAAVDRPGKGWGSATLLLPGSALYGWAIYTGAADLLLIAFVLLSLGAGGMLGGPAGWRALFLPAAFLLLLVPIPAAVVNQIIYPLQLANAHASAVVLNEVLGIPASSSGTVVTTASRTFQVIESCAGLRTMSTLWMAAIVYADLFQRSRMQTVLLLVAAPLIGAVVNLGRVLSLMLNPAGEIAAIHTLQGIIMIVVGVLLLAALDTLLVRSFPADAAYLARWSPPVHESEADGAARSRRAFGLLGFLLILTASAWLIEPWQPTRMVNWSPYAIPIEIDGWQGKTIKIDKKAMGSILPSQAIHRVYTKGRQQIALFVATDDLRGRHTSLLSPRTVLPGPAFTVREQESIRLEGVDTPVVASLLQGRFEQALSYRWIVGESSFWQETLRGGLALDHSDFVSPRLLVLVRISTSMGPTPASRLQAESRLRAFLNALGPRLETIRGPEPL